MRLIILLCILLGVVAHTEQELKSWRAKSTSTANIRVTKAMGSRDYNKVRVSLVSNETITAAEFPFQNSYISPFQYKWKQFNLASALVAIKPGKENVFTVGNQQININIPKEDEGTRGLILADPCFQSEWIKCKYATQWNMFERLTSLLNAASMHSDTQYWQILGDNFYDQEGTATDSFFNALSLETKSKVMLAVPGNHDTWVKGSPNVWTPNDQQQHGFYQYYGQDTISALRAQDHTPFDFSVDPSKTVGPEAGLPVPGNLFTYNKLGNTLFVGFSGAHRYEDQKEYFKEACSYAVQANPEVIFLEGHWNDDAMGCSDAATPDVYNHLQKMEECAPVKHKLKYMEGHVHCNQVMQKDVGFMLGGVGMSDKNGCGGRFGLTMFDTTGGKFRAFYFPINDEKKDLDYYEATLKCWQDKGVSQCYDLPGVETWADQTLPLSK